MGPKPSPIRVDRACAWQLAAVHVIIRQFALSIGHLCRCWAVRVVVSWALACTWLFVSSALLSCRLPCCCVAYCVVMLPCLAVISPTLLLVHLPCSHLDHPGVGSPALSSFGPLPLLWRSTWVLLCCRCITVFVVSLLNRRGHPGCTFITILVSPLLLSSLHHRHCIIVVFLVAVSSSWNVGVGKRGIKWGWWKTREGRKRAITKVMARFYDTPCGPPTFLGPPLWLLFPLCVILH